MGYLFDVIRTRDPFMHRIDMSRAAGIPITATAEHEGVMMDDIVWEWATRHGAPYDLELTGAAGGHWSSTDPDGERLVLDPYDFCRVLSGRAPATGLLQTQVPF